MRAIGHVLHKVDGQRSPAHRSAIADWWSGLKATEPSPAIFWQLIEEERNSILKEYQTTAGQGATAQLSGSEANLQGREPRIDPPNPTFHHYTFNSGAFKGRDQREVLNEALLWWEEQLTAIDRVANVP